MRSLFSIGVVKYNTDVPPCPKRSCILAPINNTETWSQIHDVAEPFNTDAVGVRSDTLFCARFAVRDREHDVHGDV